MKENKTNFKQSSLLNFRGNLKRVKFRIFCFCMCHNTSWYFRDGKTAPPVDKTPGHRGSTQRQSHQNISSYYPMKSIDLKNNSALSHHLWPSLLLSQVNHSPALRSAQMSSAVTPFAKGLLCVPAVRSDPRYGRERVLQFWCATRQKNSAVYQSIQTSL